MAKRHGTFEHPSDLGLEAAGDTLAELFEALGEGLARQVCPAGVSPGESRTIAATGDDVEYLVVEYLSELLSLFHMERFLVAGVRVVEASERAVRAEVTGETFDPDRHELGAEVKAVTYHGLSAERSADGWTARVLLDL